ncbi:MAG: chorismate synthase [Candidatus Micrarchaeota archaeon]|nr:chorismate synthase [Candidatus Micrarchaeota archaeon]
MSDGSFSFGSKFRITVFGSSHGPSVGVEIEGCPKGLGISEGEIQQELDRRRPGSSSIVSGRKEEDKLIVEGGIKGGKTTGEKIRMLVENKDARPQHYAAFGKTPRPGHADFTSSAKYGKMESGGGFFSGRMTAALVMAGAVAKKLLLARGIRTIAFARQIGGVKLEGEVPDQMILDNAYKNDVHTADMAVAKKMAAAVEKAKGAGDSIGGIVECRITGVPAGVGEPMFGSIESSISQAIFAIPAAKGIEFGAGFAAAGMLGSVHNDAFYSEAGQVRTRTNHAGGILGGLSSGMPIVFRVAFKPTASILMEQETVNLQTRRQEKLRIRGRHDPCIAIRAVPVVENVAAVCMADILLGNEEGEHEA